MRSRFLMALVAVLSLSVLGARTAQAQGKGHGKGHKGKDEVVIIQQGRGHHDRDDDDDDHDEREHRAKKVKVVTVDHALETTRIVLVEQGYSVIRVRRVGATQVVYFRRGNNGRGRGLGPVQTLVIRPAQERVVFESAPSPVLLQLNVRLGL